MRHIHLGYIITYDTNSGKMIAINEIIEEQSNAKELDNANKIEKEDCDQFCALVQKQHTDKTIGAFIAPQGFIYKPENTLNINLQDQSIVEELYSAEK